MKSIARFVCILLALVAMPAFFSCNKTQTAETAETTEAATEIVDTVEIADTVEPVEAEEPVVSTDPETPKPTKTKDKMTTPTQKNGSAKVKIETSLGSFTVMLYGDTPKHRDNFLKLVKEGTYEGTLFHRVIKEFMVQAGDPDSKTARPGQQLGAGDVGYTLPAEIVFPTRFHKRGALAAARQGDQVNPEKRSSGCQFYVVTGKKVQPNQLEQLKQQMQYQQMQTVFNGLVQERKDEVVKLQQNSDQAGLKALQEELIKKTEEIVAAMPVTMTPEMIEAYTTVGGSPHLDGQYTVFGEVVDGMSVIDAIEKVATDRSDRPTDDIKIIKAEIISE